MQARAEMVCDGRHETARFIAHHRFHGNIFKVSSFEASNKRFVDPIVSTARRPRGYDHANRSARDSLAMIKLIAVVLPE